MKTTSSKTLKLRRPKKGKNEDPLKKNKNEDDLKKIKNKDNLKK